MGLYPRTVRYLRGLVLKCISSFCMMIITWCMWDSVTSGASSWGGFSRSAESPLGHPCLLGRSWYKQPAASPELCASTGDTDKKHWSEQMCNHHKVRWSPTVNMTHVSHHLKCSKPLSLSCSSNCKALKRLCSLTYQDVPMFEWIHPFTLTRSLLVQNPNRSTLRVLHFSFRFFFFRVWTVCCKVHCAFANSHS